MNTKRRIKTMPEGKCSMMKSEKYIPALEEWTLSTEGEISGVKIVYLVPNELVGEAERLGAVKILKDEKEDNK